MSMKFRQPNTDRATEMWDRRADALEAGTVLLNTKPNHRDWSREEWRIWRYALAISRRLDKLH